MFVRALLDQGTPDAILVPQLAVSLDLAVVHLSNRQIARHVRLFKEFVVEMAPTLFPDPPA